MSWELVFVALLFNLIDCSFLVIPLKSFKRNNPDLPFNNTKIQKYLEKDFNPDNFMKKWYAENNIFAECSIGSPPVKLYANILTNNSKTSLVIDSIYQKENNLNVFSQSIQNISSLSIYKTSFALLVSGYITEAFHFLFTDDLNLNNLTEKTAFLEFGINDFQIGLDKLDINATEPLRTANITFSLAFGIQVENHYMRTSFISNLKNSDTISSYYFTVEFYKKPFVNEEEEFDVVGRFVFGEFEELYNKEKYPDEHLKVTKLIPDGSNIMRYAIELDNVYMTNATDNSTRIPITERFATAEFTFNQALILGSNEYQKIIEEEFFDKYGDGLMCHKNIAKSMYQYYKTDFYVYICDKEILYQYKEFFPNLYFYQKDFDFTFEFKFEELFREYLGKVYFMIVFKDNTPSPRHPEKKWEFGKIFLKKYKLFFNSDAKTAKFYSVFEEEKSDEEEEKESEVSSGIPKPWLIVIEVISIGLVIVLAYFLGKYLNKKRKLRANELEDYYEYENGKNLNKNSLELK